MQNNKINTSNPRHRDVHFLILFQINEIIIKLEPQTNDGRQSTFEYCFDTINRMEIKTFILFTYLKYLVLKPRSTPVRGSRF